MHLLGLYKDRAGYDVLCVLCLSVCCLSVTLSVGHFLK